MHSFNTHTYVQLYSFLPSPCQNSFYLCSESYLNFQWLYSFYFISSVYHLIIYIIIIPLLSLPIPNISLCFLLRPKLFSFIKNKQKPPLLCLSKPSPLQQDNLPFPSQVGKCAYTHWLYFLSSHSFLHWQQSGFYCQSFTETILKRLNYQIHWIPLSLHLTWLLWRPR